MKIQKKYLKPPSIAYQWGYDYPLGNSGSLDPHMVPAIEVDVDSTPHMVWLRSIEKCKGRWGVRDILQKQWGTIGGSEFLPFANVQMLFIFKTL